MNLQKKGILLINLGTPKLPEPDYIASYLKEFLMDPDVIKIPALFRWILVNWIIIPKRKFASSLKYKSIWTSRGSPLLFHSEDFLEKFKIKTLQFSVKLAMRYGEPSIYRALQGFNEEGLGDFILAPLYPQYAEATTGSTVKEVQRLCASYFPKLKFKVLPPFFSHEAFLDTWTNKYKKANELHSSFDHVLFSFHGLPKERNGSINCYEQQSIETAERLAKKMSLKEGAWSYSFQSRLGRAEWIKPYTNEVIVSLAKRGIKRLCVICPAFTADCLETLEEINIGENENFLENGGEFFYLLPSLNAEDDWVDSFAKITNDFIYSSMKV